MLRYLCFNTGCSKLAFIVMPGKDLIHAYIAQKIQNSQRWVISDLQFSAHSKSSRATTTIAQSTYSYYLDTKRSKPHCIILFSGFKRFRLTITPIYDLPME